MTTLDPRALKAARSAYQSAIPDGCWHTDGGETDAPIRAAITAYLALSQPQAGEPVSWGVFARAICESEGRDWTALDNPREDCERWIKAGQACAALASPSPAPGVVTDEMVETAARAYAEHQHGKGCPVWEEELPPMRAALASLSQPAKEREGEPCGLADPSYQDCKNMKEVGGGFDGERYRCDVCGKGYFLDYEDMK